MSFCNSNASGSWSSHSQLVAQISVIRILLPTLYEELEHENRSDVVRKTKKMKFRVTCGM